MVFYSEEQKGNIIATAFCRLQTQQDALEQVRVQIRTFRQQCDFASTEEAFGEILKFFGKFFPEHQDRMPVFKNRKKTFDERLAIFKAFLEGLAAENTVARKQNKEYLANLS